MREIAAGLMLLLAACNQKSAPMDDVERMDRGPLSEKEVDRVRSTIPGMTEACVDKVRKGGLLAIPRETDKCFEMTPPRQWRGLWLDAFEGQQFCPAPATECSFRSKPQIWMEVPGRKCCTYALYEVEFVGRRTKHPGGFGHFGMFEHEMIVDRMISIEKVPEQARE